jgi:hypothetical protein
MENVSATAGGAGSTSYAMAVGGQGMIVAMNNVEMRVSGGVSDVGLSADSFSQTTITNSKISSDGYGMTLGAVVTVKHSTISGVTAIQNNNGTLSIAVSQVDGPLSGVGTLRCFQVYDANFAGICP